MFVVNLFGAPGAGKSTGAAYIFSKLKMAGVNAELVTEYAKDKVWEEDKAVFANQTYILGKQSFRLSRLKSKVDVAVTDSPLLLSSFYNKEYTVEFDALVNRMFDSYDNLNWFIQRTKPYNAKGRFQTEKESDQVAGQLYNFLCSKHIEFKRETGSLESYDKIVDEVLKVLKKE